MKKGKRMGRPGRSFGRSAMRTHKFNLPSLRPMRGGIRL